MKASVYLINRFLSSVLSGNSSYELLFSKVSKFSHLRVIGCLCYVILVPRDDKFSERAKHIVLMDYFETQKGFLLLDIQFERLLVSRDVVFQDDVFLLGSCNNRFRL